MAIIFTMYNLRRVTSELGIKGLIERLKQWKAAQKGQKQGVVKYFCSCKPL